MNAAFQGPPWSVNSFIHGQVRSSAVCPCCISIWCFYRCEVKVVQEIKIGQLSFKPYHAVFWCLCACRNTVNVYAVHILLAAQVFSKTLELFSSFHYKQCVVAFFLKGFNFKDKYSDLVIQMSQYKHKQMQCSQGAAVLFQLPSFYAYSKELIGIFLQM